MIVSLALLCGCGNDSGPPMDDGPPQDSQPTSVGKSDDGNGPNPVEGDGGLSAPGDDPAGTPEPAGPGSPVPGPGMPAANPVDPAPTNAGEPCNADDSVPCPCPDGMEGFRTCLVGASSSMVGTYSECRGCPTCTNGIQDRGEGDVDCGGFCEPCGPGRSCVWDMDCTTSFCQRNVCAHRTPGASGEPVPPVVISVPGNACLFDFESPADAPDRLLMIVDEPSLGKQHVPRSFGWSINDAADRVTLTGQLCTDVESGRFAAITFEYERPDVPAPPQLPPLQ